MKKCFQVQTIPTKASVALLIMRLVAGLAFMYHGWGKIQSPMSWMGPESSIPGIFQLLAAVSEYVGGLFWMLGLLTPLASLGMAITMAVAAFFHAVILKDPFVPSGPGGSYELASIYFCLSILFIAIGPGKLSLDQKIFGNK